MALDLPLPTLLHIRAEKQHTSSNVVRIKSMSTSHRLEYVLSTMREVLPGTVLTVSFHDGRSNLRGKQRQGKWQRKYCEIICQSVGSTEQQSSERQVVEHLLSSLKKMNPLNLPSFSQARTWGAPLKPIHYSRQALMPGWYKHIIHPVQTPPWTWICGFNKNTSKIFVKYASVLNRYRLFPCYYFPNNTV